MPTHQLTGTTFYLEARENGQVVSRAFTTACSTTPPVVTPPVTPPTGAFAVLTPGYDCNTGRLTAQVANAGGSSVEFRIAGLRGWATSNSFSVPSYQRNGTSFKIEARTANGAYATMDFTSTFSNISPIVPPFPTPPSGRPLSFGLSALYCDAGLLNLITSGGDGTSIECQAWEIGKLQLALSFRLTNAKTPPLACMPGKAGAKSAHNL